MKDVWWTWSVGVTNRSSLSSPSTATRLSGTFCSTSPVSIESSQQTHRAVGLGPMAVRPDFQGQGIGRQLIEEGLQVCRRAGYEIVVVLGHPSYYPRFGFMLARAQGIHWEQEVPGDAFMVTELKPGALQGCQGTARYLPEFMSL